MKIKLTDSTKQFLRSNVTLFDALTFNSTAPLNLDVALAYIVLAKANTNSKSLQTIYSLAEVTVHEGVTKLFSDYKNHYKKEMNKDEQYAVFKKMKSQAEGFAKRFFKEYIKNYDNTNDFYIGMMELAGITQFCNKNITERVFEIDEDKYNILLGSIIDRMNIDNLKMEKVTTQDSKNQENKDTNQNKKNNLDRIRKYGAEDLVEKEYVRNPLIGLEKELRRAKKCLLSGNSFLILGDSGVGKTTLVKGLAYSIKVKDVPECLKNKRIVSISIPMLVSDTEYVGTLEAHLKDIIYFAKKNPNIVYFMDEIHTIVGAGTTKKSNIDIANILKPYIEDKTVQIIGATTQREFDKSIATDPAFRRRFQKTIKLSEPSEEDTYKIVKNYIDILEEEKNIKFSLNDDFLHTLITYTNSKNRSYFETVNNPNISLGVINDIFVSAEYYGKTSIDKDDVIEGIEDNEILASTKKEELIRVLSNDKFYSKKKNKKTKTKILKFPNQNKR